MPAGDPQARDEWRNRELGEKYWVIARDTDAVIVASLSLGFRGWSVMLLPEFLRDFEFVRGAEEATDETE